MKNWCWAPPVRLQKKNVAARSHSHEIHEAENQRANRQVKQRRTENLRAGKIESAASLAALRKITGGTEAKQEMDELVSGKTWLGWRAPLTNIWSSERNASMYAPGTLIWEQEKQHTWKMIPGRGQLGTNAATEDFNENPKYFTVEGNLDVEIKSECKKKPDWAELRVATK
jgi:hypothetical protein